MAADRDRERWDPRHAAGRSEPSAPFGAAHLPEDLRGRTALDVAAGTGGVSLWAATLGMQVTAIDISPVGLGLLDQAAAALGLSALVTTVCRDLDEGLGTVVTFDLVVCRNFRDPDLYPALAAAVSPGGWLSISVLGGDGRFAAEADELPTAFADLGVPVDAGTDERAHHALFRRSA